MRATPASDAPAAERLQPGDPGTPRQVRRSAVERLAADRAKYVRGLPAAQGGGASAAAAQESAPDAPARAQAPVVRRVIARRPLRPDSLVIYRQKCEFVRTPGTDGSKGSLGKKLLPVQGKDRVPAPSDTQGVGEESGYRGRDVGTAPMRQGLAESLAPSASSAPPAAHPAPSAPSAAPRTSSAPSAAPLASSAPPAAHPAPSAPSAAPRTSSAPPAAHPAPSAPSAAPRTSSAPPAAPLASSAPPAAPPASSVPSAAPRTSSAPSAAPRTSSAASQSVAPVPPGLELRVARRRGLQRSQSDLSSLSSTAKAECDAFFQYCGLDPDVVEALGRENFSASSDCVALKVRSVSVATSDSGFSRRSDDDGEDGLSGALKEQGPSATSVIERNARIIKWLYTCRKAREGPGQRLQGPA
ncbi:protein FAM110C [Ochotona curzoniae]|uniref:protein FAM110C n=1 Tax=Ochotona curzoniae TaxID=130825 RepID=UPI001B34BC18|nr:protein FAM110C [Ochotona curzoniae]